MKILIVDDEAPARARLQTLIAALGEHEVTGSVGNGAQALQACEEQPPDVVLLDIRMPGMDGLQVAERLNRNVQPPAIIFVTAYSDHALQAFEAEAVDYLLKPVRRERLAEALRKARRLNRAQVEAFSQLEPEPETRSHILCRRRSGLDLIPFDEIRFFQADNKYVTVNHLQGEDLIEESLKQLEREFPDRLVRIHRNALIVMDYLAGLERSGGQYYAVVRDSDIRLEVSRRHVSVVRGLLRRLGEGALTSS